METRLLSSSPVSGAYRVNISRGSCIGRVSSEWFSRPDDERYLSRPELYHAVKRRAERASTHIVPTEKLHVEARQEGGSALWLVAPHQDKPIAPTHWSFGQLCSLVGAPASYLRSLPSVLAGINLQHGLLSRRSEAVKLLETDEDRLELRAVTGPEYGRIWDHELVEAVMKITGNGTGDTNWKVPGLGHFATVLLDIGGFCPEVG